MNGEKSMDTIHSPGNPRKPIIALLFSLAATGLGHIYCGKLSKGLILFFIGFVFAPIIGSSVESISSASTLALVIVSILILVAVFIYASIDAYIMARKMTGPYELREYNRWYIYLLFIIVSVSYPSSLTQNIKSHIVQAYKISSASMEPGLVPKDYVLLNKAAYNLSTPQRGDVVIFIYPNDRRIHYIKRIVALPGDTVEIKNNVLFINDRPLQYRELGPIETEGKEEPGATFFEEVNDPARYKILLNTQEAPISFAKQTVPNGYCFVLGDNRSVSKDSRDFGPIPLADVRGRVDYIYWPAQSWSRFGPYSD